jgi:cell division GTPase FtsZ
MKERILFECVGQAGGNIGKLLLDKGYICHFINSSLDDLNAIDVRDNFKFHIPNAMGCSKDRKKAMMFAKEYYPLMMETINRRFAMEDIVYFVFSLGGGTGSGIAPILLDFLSTNNPSKHYGAIVILPSTSEPIKAQANAIEAFNQLKRIDNLKNIFVIDNSCGMNKMDINVEFVNLFDELMNITKPDIRGVIDQDELATILTTNGMITMGSFDNENLKDNIISNSIFAPSKYNCNKVAVSVCNDDVDVELIESITNYPNDIYVGYNDDRNFIVLCGMPFVTDRIEKLANTIKSKQFDRVNDVLEKDVDVPTIEKVSKPKSKVKVSFDDVFGKFIN